MELEFKGTKKEWVLNSCGDLIMSGITTVADTKSPKLKTMKLTIEHLAAYLPYDLKMRLHGNYPIKEGFDNWITDFQTLDIKRIHRALTDKNFLPILRPLSDLTKEIEHNGEKFVPIDYLNEKYIENSSGIDTTYLLMPEHVDGYPYYIIKHLHSWHFDTFGLIDAGLAIDTNELNR